jgi:hypothetical protein
MQVQLPRPGRSTFIEPSACGATIAASCEIATGAAASALAMGSVEDATVSFAPANALEVPVFVLLAPAFGALLHVETASTAAPKISERFNVDVISRSFVCRMAILLTCLIRNGHQRIAARQEALRSGRKQTLAIWKCNNFRTIDLGPGFQSADLVIKFNCNN